MALLGRCRPLCAAFAHPPLLIFAGVVWTACLFRDWKWLCLERCHLLRASFTLPTHPPFLNIRAGCCVDSLLERCHLLCAVFTLPPHPPLNIRAGRAWTACIFRDWKWLCLECCHLLCAAFTLPTHPFEFPGVARGQLHSFGISSHLPSYLHPLARLARAEPVYFRAPGARQALLFRAPGARQALLFRAPSARQRDGSRAPGARCALSISLRLRWRACLSFAIVCSIVGPLAGLDLASSQFLLALACLLLICQEH